MWLYDHIRDRSKGITDQSNMRLGQSREIRNGSVLRDGRVLSPRRRVPAEREPSRATDRQLGLVEQLDAIEILP